MTSITVFMDDNGITVKRFNKEAFINYSEIASISGGFVGKLRLPNEKLVTIQFGTDTPFGRKISFFPPIDPYFSTFPSIDLNFEKYFDGYEHAVVNMLKERINFAFT